MLSEVSIRTAIIIQRARMHTIMIGGVYSLGFLLACRIIEEGMASYFAENDQSFDFNEFVAACGRSAGETDPFEKEE